MAGSLKTAWGAVPDTGGDQPFSFHISAGLLPQVLTAFSSVTGIEVVADARNTQDCQSQGVAGVMTAREALGALTAGTHLLVDEFAPGTVTLSSKAGVNGTGPCGADAASSVAKATDATRYFGLIQRAVLRALCRNGKTVPGNYRLALKLWIDDAGIVSQAKRLGSTGNSDRNLAVDAVLQRLDIGMPTPVDLPQPVAIVIQPRASLDVVDCPMASGGQ